VCVYVCVFGVVCVCVCFEVGVSLGYGFPYDCGMRVYGHVKWPIYTAEPLVYAVSGGCPSAAWLASVSARSLHSEWLCALILLRFMRMPDSHRVLRVRDGEERVPVNVVTVGG
jgi:hypothetical protein